MTQLVKQVLEQRRETLRRTWEAGSISDWNSHTHALLNAASIGECKAYAFVCDLDYEQLLGELDDGTEKPVGPETSGESGAD